MKYYESKDSINLINWDNLASSEEVNKTCYGNNAIVVIGYYRQESNDKKPFFVRQIVADTKEHMLLQHHEDYDLVILITDHDKEGNSIEDIWNKVKGVIKIDGRLKEEFTDRGPESRKVWGVIAHQISVTDGSMRAFSASFIEKEKPKKQTSRKRKKSLSSSEEQPSAAN